MNESRDAAFTNRDRSESTISARGNGRQWWEALTSRGALLTCIGGIFFCLGQLAGAVQNGDKVLSADRVLARSFVLLGTDGKPSALLHTTDLGDTMLSFYDQKRTVRVNLGVSSHGQPGLDMFDANAAEKLGLYVDPVDGNPNILLSGEASGNARAHLSIIKNRPNISFRRPKLGRLTLGLDDEGQPHMALVGTGDARGMYFSASESEANISLSAKEGIPRAICSLLPDGAPALLLADGKGKVYVELTVDKEGKTSSQKFKP
jgi:hypothetical protein